MHRSLLEERGDTGNARLRVVHVLERGLGEEREEAERRRRRLGLGLRVHQVVGRVVEWRGEARASIGSVSGWLDGSALYRPSTAAKAAPVS